MQHVRDSHKITVSSRSFAAAALAAAAAFAFVGLVDPTQAHWLPKCPFYAITGLYCPGCGTLRCLHRLAHGDIVGALRFNVLTVTLVPMMLWALAAEMRDKPLPVPKWTAWAFIAVLIVFGIARNIPVYPLRLLAPH